MDEQNSNSGSLIPFGNRNLQRLSNSIRITKKLLSVSNFESVIIGNQEWMVRNLNVDRFRNGDLIPEIQDPDEWAQAGEDKKPAWCYHDNDPENGKIYGRLYNWYAVNDPRGLAPVGWHVPSIDEWGELISSLGGETLFKGTKNERYFTSLKRGVGTRMKATIKGDSEIGNWLNETLSPTNESGFSALPSGYRQVFFDQCEFVSIGTYTNWWSSTKRNENEVYSQSIQSDSDSSFRGVIGVDYGASVRCVKTQ